MKPTRLPVLTPDECNSIREAALTIMSEIGVLVTHAEAVSLLLGAGARQGEDGRITMDAAVLRALLAHAPSRFTLFSRGGEPVELGSGRSWTCCGGTASRVAEWPGWSLRSATREDVGRFARLCDALPLVHCVVPLVEAQDVDPARAEVVTFMETLANTTKFTFVCPVRHASARAWVEMGRIATGEKDLGAEPKIGLLATVLPSLRLDDDCAATSILAAREGLPLIVMGGPIAGVSGPNTIASHVALKLAGELFQAALVQAAEPGAPVLLDCTGTVGLDMNTTDIGESGPESVLGLAAVVEAASEFDLPTYSCALDCDAKIGDFQAGLEKMAGMLAAALAGVDLTTNIGMVSRCSASSYEQVVLDHELCTFVERITRGVTVNDDTLALDVVREVGMGGDFLMHEHTLRHCRSGEMWYPKLLDRTPVSAERADPYVLAHEKVERLLDTHQPAVPDEVRRALQSYVPSAS